MSSRSREKLIEKVSREQRAFNEQVEALLSEHRGEYVLFNDGSPVEFYDGFEEAFVRASSASDSRVVFSFPK